MSNYIYELKGVDGQLYVDNDFISIERKGSIGFLSYGIKGKRSIPIASITAIQVKEGNSYLNGFIQFSVLGGADNRVRPVRFVTSSNDENKIIFRMKDNEKVFKIKQFLQSKISNTDTNSSSIKLSAADEIAKFKQLLDSGVISNDEFNIKKKQLLDNY